MTSTYGGYGGYGSAHPMDASVVATQETDAKNMLGKQFDVQTKMLNHQAEAQIKMLEAEKKRMIDVMTAQYDQQYLTQKLAIQQQAAQMTAQAKQYEMALEMQKSMAAAYGGVT